MRLDHLLSMEIRANASGQALYSVGSKDQKLFRCGGETKTADILPSYHFSVVKVAWAFSSAG